LAQLDASAIAMAALTSQSCLGALWQQPKQQSSEGIASGYGGCRVAVPTSSAPLHSSFAGQQIKVGLKYTTNSVRRRQGGQDSRSEQLRLLVSAVASTESAEAATATSSFTTSVLGLEVVENLQPNSRVWVLPYPCGLPATVLIK
jgi:hypothetical protein